MTQNLFKDILIKKADLTNSVVGYSVYYHGLQSQNTNHIKFLLLLCVSSSIFLTPHVNWFCCCWSRRIPKQLLTLSGPLGV